LLDQQTLKYIIALNQEHASTTSPHRRREIEDEIVRLVPPSLTSNSPDALRLEQMQSALAEQLSKLNSIASQGEIYAFLQHVKILQESIQQYASLLGVKIDPVDIEAVERQFLTERRK
jgi:hypothetical protein